MSMDSSTERGRIGEADRPPSSVAAKPAPVPQPRHLGWHSRGYLPHCDAPGLIQAVTFRLADSLPRSQSAVWAELSRLSVDVERRALAESWLDRGCGSCALRNPAFAELVQTAVLHFDGHRCRVLAWAIMPNHVHALVEIFAGWPLQVLVKSWKSYSARAINTQLGQRGAFWQADYFDRFIRDEAHLRREVAYIENNPVLAGLTARATDWPWSSASR